MATIRQVVTERPLQVTTAGIAAEEILQGAPVVKSYSSGYCRNAVTDEEYPIEGFAQKKFAVGDVVSVISNGEALAIDKVGTLSEGDLVSAGGSGGTGAGVIDNTTAGKAIGYAMMDSGDAAGDIILINLNSGGVNSGTNVTDATAPTAVFISSEDLTDAVIDFGEDLFSDASRTPITDGTDIKTSFTLTTGSATAEITTAIYNKGKVTFTIANPDTDLAADDDIAINATSIYDAMGNAAASASVIVVNAGETAWEAA